MFAVIELGTTSVRMVLAQADEAGKVQTLDSLQQPVTLGRDSFTQGRIGQDTTEKCVEALRRFDRVLKEYGVRETGQVCAVATSAVREAANRQAFLDRVFIATGIEVEELDAAEVGRLTYLAVRPLLEYLPDGEGDVLVAEVGGGSTEALQLHSGKVAHAHTFRLGSLRLHEMIEELRTPAVHTRDALLGHVDRDVGQIVKFLELGDGARLLALGGDARLAARVLLGDASAAPVVSVPVSALSKLTNSILAMSVDETFQRYHTSYPDAETLGPALLIYTRLAEKLNMSRVHVGKTSLRDGLLYSMTNREWWTREFASQVLTSSHDLGRRYGIDTQHAQNVAQFARQLFQVLQAEHQLGPHYEVLLTVAAELHDVGVHISPRSHHKHSMYLILNSDLFGLSAQDKLLTALIARYHRKAVPRPTHLGYTSLDREGRVAVAKLAAILRVADALDRQHRGRRRRRPSIELQPGRLVITFNTAGDLALEKHALLEKGQMFKQVYGMDVILQSTWKAASDER